MMNFVNLLFGIMLSMVFVSDHDSKWLLAITVLLFFYIYNFDTEGFFGEED